MRNVTHTTLDTTKPINGMNTGKDSEIDAPQTREGVFVKRRRRRRLDLKSLNGTLRESARVYRELAEGRISMAEAEVRSRVLRRHSEIMGTIEQRDLLAKLNDQLNELRAQSVNGAAIPQLPNLTSTTET